MKCLAMTTCFIISGTILMQASDPPKREANSLEGKWNLESFEYNGLQILDQEDRPRDPEELFVVKGNDLNIVSHNRIVASLIVAINPYKSPKQIDLSIGNNVIFRGIYALDGEHLFVSISHSKVSDSYRPNTFNASDKKGGIAVFIFRKAKQKDRKDKKK